MGKTRVHFQPIRFFLFIIGIVIFFTMLFIRLVEVQLVRGVTFVNQAEDNRFYTHRLQANRGVFLDRYSDPLVWNMQKYAQINDPTALYVQRTPIERTEALKLMATDSAKVQTYTERFYRYPYSLAHVLGYVGDVTAEDLQRDDTLAVNQEVGKTGLEYVYEKQLRGIDGKETFEINALGEKQRLIQTQPALPGTNLPTSLDPYITEVAARALKGQRGGVIITAADTGEVLALTSQPAFDPNLLSQSFVNEEQETLRKEHVSQLFNDPQRLFFDRVVAGAYPPGSVFKLVTALSALEQGKIDASTIVVDEGSIRVGEFEFGNWYYRQYGRTEGPINLTRSIARSNDIFFYKAAEWVGPDQLATTARAFGFGEKTGIDLPTEARGLVPDPEWKARVKNEKWFLGNTYHYGIGQGDLLTSPIQVAQMTQAVANNGLLCKVSLVTKEERECRDIVSQKSHLEMVVDGMIQACSAGGTAFPFFPYNTARLIEGQSVSQKIDAGAIACKTGTAEFGGANEQGYRKTHGWFTSFFVLPDFKNESMPDLSEASLATEAATLAAPQETLSRVDQYSDEDLYRLWRTKVHETGFPRKITITVLVESDETNLYKEGSRDAAPVAKAVVDWMSHTSK